MNPPSQDDPTGRFSGLVDLYSRHRPDYPPQAIEQIIQHGNLRDPSSLLIDMGSGTGISTRLFAARGVRVLGIEPNEEMRREAEATPPPEGTTWLAYRPGRAEATGLDDGVATMILAAQSFHWFDPDTTLPEFHRVLAREGSLALMWNERDESDPFTADYGQVIRSAPDAPQVEGGRARAGEVLRDSPLFDQVQLLHFQHSQLLVEEGVLGRAFSASYVPKDGAHGERIARELHQVFARHQQQGKVVLRYRTLLYLARKRLVQTA
jgi:ubiquinone/menaquinone biosynthesis C-methylase UbiE